MHRNTLYVYICMCIHMYICIAIHYVCMYACIYVCMCVSQYFNPPKLLTPFTPFGMLFLGFVFSFPTPVPPPRGNIPSTALSLSTILISPSHF